MRLFRGHVPLALVALHAREHAILPRRPSTARTRNDVIDGEIMPVEFRAAELTGIAVPDAQVAPGKCDACTGNTTIVRENDNLRHAEDNAHGMDALMGRRMAGKVSPGIEIVQGVRIRGDDFRYLLVHETDSASRLGEPHRQPVPVEDERVRR